MASCFGTLFRVSTFGESHGPAVGCVVDGCPPGVSITTHDIQAFLNRRKPGQNLFTSPRTEPDICHILSGVENNRTLGTPLALVVHNTNHNPAEYQNVLGVFRPSHADFTYAQKYGVVATSGGGRASARETVGRVAAAAIAKACVHSFFPKIEVLAWVERIHNIAAQVDLLAVRFEDIERSPIRCPDTQAAILMQEKILQVKAQGDTLGGLVCCLARDVPPGLGEPVFDKLEADFAKAMLSLPAVRSFEVGEGLAATFLKGSENNDSFVQEQSSHTRQKKRIRTSTNRSGGIQGGISNGMPIFFRVGFKPVSTLFQKQRTLTKDGHETHFEPTTGRHDSCVLPRAVPLVEAMCWLTLADHLLRHIALQPQFLKEHF